MRAFPFASSVPPDSNVGVPSVEASGHTPQCARDLWESWGRVCVRWPSTRHFSVKPISVCFILTSMKIIVNKIMILLLEWILI